MATQAQNSDLCSCGRDLNKVHCPHCGCATVYGLAKQTDKITRSDMSVQLLRVYRCRKCAGVFNDDDRTRCVAPAPVYGAARQPAGTSAKHSEQQIHYASIDEVPEDMRAALDIIKKKRGLA